MQTTTTKATDEQYRRAALLAVRAGIGAGIEPGSAVHRIAGDEGAYVEVTVYVSAADALALGAREGRR
jgi:hypothetical protein